MENQSPKSNQPRINIENNQVCLKTGVITNDQGVNKLEPLPLAFLSYLLSRSGDTVSHQDLISEVWQNRQVGDDAIRRVVKKLRTALNDDAKNSRIIKTIPLKGYSFVADVTEVVAEKPNSKPLFMWGTLGFIALFFIALLTLAYPTKVTESEATITPLTQISGSEMNGTFAAASNTLLFIHRDSHTSPFDLYSKQLDNGIVRQLTFDQDSYLTAEFSPDQSKLLLYKFTPEGYFSYLADYENHSLLNQTRIEIDLELGVTRSWAFDGKSIFVNGKKQGSSDARAIYQYHFETQALDQITFPYVKGIGDYYAKQSDDGKFIAVMRNHQDNQHQLLIFDTAEKRILHTMPINFKVNTLFWPEGQSQQLVLSSFKGTTAIFDTSNNELAVIGEIPTGVNDAFYRCGEKCLFMRRHHMNYRDIQELPNTLVDAPETSKLRISTPNSDWSPIYNSTGDEVYFLSRDTEFTYLYKLDNAGKQTLLYQFDTYQLVNELSLNPQDTHLLGRLEQRVFVYDLQNKTFTWLNSEDEQIDFPNWGQNGNTIYYSRIEQGTKQLLKYNLVDNTSVVIAIDELTRYVDTQGRTFVLKDNFQLMQKLDDGKELFIANLPQHEDAHFVVNQDYVYWSTNEDLDINLNQYNLITGEYKKQVIAPNSWTMEFSIHPEGHSVLISKELLADSDLVKVEW